MPLSHDARKLTVSLVVVPEVSAAVTYGLHEVFTCVGAAWEMLTGERTQSRRMAPRIVGSRVGPVRTTLGATIFSEHSFGESLRSDVVIIGDLSLEPEPDLSGRWDEAIHWMLDQHARGAIICSVCTGSLILAEAGLLERREATSHWSATRYFRECYPGVRLQPQRVIVPSGDGHDVVTSGGSASWTDLSLYLIARFCGDAEARRIAKIFLFGDRSEGQLPFAAMVRPKQHEDASIADSQGWISENYAIANPVAEMTKRSGLADRTFKRRFQSATGYTPIDYVQTLRVEEAKQMLETSNQAIDDIAQAVGYDDPNSFRRLFKRTVGVAPQRYRQRFKSVGIGAA
jgi:transcriptional regulator GlxA family with amidase domain